MSVNCIGLTKADYKGSKSTLCPGCGHNSITAHLTTVLWQEGLDPAQTIKMSGIGCSSKTTNYFMNRAHGFNAVHGRMPAIATGALLANHTLHCVGISGDGDTASIGMGHFVHLIRRNVPMVYIIENNGVYGLTKGQFSATADVGSTTKRGEPNVLPPIDLCELALVLGCDFVARSFSGDKKQLVPLLQAALHHPGTAVIDVISPCVTFNDHRGSTKSYDFVKEHDEPLQELGFIHPAKDIEVEFDEGTTTDVPMADGSILTLRKLAKEHDTSDRAGALALLLEARQRGELLTGLFFIDPTTRNFFESLDLAATPLARLSERELRPSPAQLTQIMDRLR